MAPQRHLTLVKGERYARRPGDASADDADELAAADAAARSQRRIFELVRPSACADQIARSGIIGIDYAQLGGDVSFAATVDLEAFFRR